MSNSKKVIELDMNDSLSDDDLSYVVEYGPGPSWADKKVNLKTLRNFNYLSQTESKGSSYTIHASECDKRWFSNEYATGSVFFMLPELSSKMEVGFFVGAFEELTVYPQSLNKIMPLTPSPGFGLRSNVPGSSVYLKYYSEGWLIISMSGTWNIVLPYGVSSSSSSSTSSSSCSTSSISSSSCSMSSSSCSASCSSSSSSSAAPIGLPAFVATGNGTNTLVYSYNGINWFASANGNAVNPVIGNGVCYNGSIFVAGGATSGGNALMYSNDGVNWFGSANGNTVFSFECRDVCWNGSIFVAAGSGTNTLAYSNDGINWTASGNGNSIIQLGNAVCWNGSMFIAGGSGNPNSLAYSFDGISWTGSVNGNSVMGSCYGVCWNGSMFIAGGSWPNRIAYSYDGINWTGSTNGNSIFDNVVYNICWNGSMLVAAGGQGGGSNTLAYSYDGVNWTASANGNSIISNLCYGLCWNGDKFVAAGHSVNRLAYSTDGINWIASANGNDVFTNGGGYVCSTVAPNLYPPIGTWNLTIETTAPGDVFDINIASGNDVDIDIDWGQGGSFVNYNSTGIKTSPAYSVAGTYTVKIKGGFSNNGNIRIGTTAAIRARLKSTSVIPEILGLLHFYETFFGCSNLTSIPSGLFDNNTAVSTAGFYRTFSGCTNLTSIPSGLFDNNTSVSNGGFGETFRDCISLTAIPEGLFDNNTAVSTNGFNSTFSGCTNLTSIPSGLFDNNTAVSTYGFAGTFFGCSSLTSIPSGLFDNNTAVSTDGFNSTFSGCTNLTAIPAGLFRNNINVSLNTFVATFSDCNNLTLNKWIFFAPGEENTRFLDKSVSFHSCFFLFDAFTGTKGEAPELWNCSFGTGTPTTARCFDGHSLDSVSNYGNIPSAWK